MINRAVASSESLFWFVKAPGTILNLPTMTAKQGGTIGSVALIFSGFSFLLYR